MRKVKTVGKYVIAVDREDNWFVFSKDEYSMGEGLRYYDFECGSLQECLDVIIDDDKPVKAKKQKVAKEHKQKVAKADTAPDTKKEELEFINRWTGEKTLLYTEGLTEKEVLVMVAIRNNEYSDIYDCDSGLGDWSLGVCDESGLEREVYRGVVSSLIKKGLVEVYEYGRKGSIMESVIVLTDSGKARYDK